MRTTDTALDPIFLERWSPRAFDRSDMPESDLRTILDAARWAPSAFNCQPWRFLYSLRKDKHWEQFLSLLQPFNAAWAGNASALIFIVSDKLMRRGEKTTKSHSHSFDAGAAWAQMGLQAIKLGYFAHAMLGIELNKIAQDLQVPNYFRVEAGVAIGRKAPSSTLPEALREREIPSDRKPLNEIAFAGPFRC